MPSRHLGLICLMTLLLFGVWNHSVEATCGKVDVGPAYVHIDVLESGKTVKTLNMAAVRADASYLIKEGSGLCIKPYVLYASGGGELFNGGLGLGYCWPVNDRLIVTPLIGCAYTYMHTHIHVEMQGHKFRFKEKFRSYSPYVGAEATWKIADGWRVCFMIQYAWSRTRTVINKLIKAKSHSKGPSYSAMLEYDINDQWSVNIGGAYNITLSHERHGLRGAGVKLGIARWF